MGKSKVVQDSDEESGVESAAGGNPTSSHPSPMDLSLSPIVNLEYSSTPEEPSTESAERLNHTIPEYHSPPFEPTTGELGPGLKSNPVSSQHSRSSSTRGTKRRRATTAFEKPNEKKPLKKYGSKASQRAAELDRHSDDDGRSEQFRKSTEKNGVALTHGTMESHGENWVQVDDCAAKRVEAMLQEYHAAKDDLTTSISSFSSAPMLDTSLHKTTYGALPRVAETQEPHSQPSTVPTLPTISDITSANLTPATAAKSSTSNEQHGAIQNVEQKLHSVNEVTGQELNKSITRKHSSAVFDSNSNERHDTRLSFKKRHTGTSLQRPEKSVNAEEESVEGHDELACCVSDTSASAAEHRPACLSEQSQATSSLHADELGLDEPIVGLPKERYQPRPSRSRSQRNNEELMIPTDFSKRPEIAAKKKGSKRRKTTALAKPSPRIEVDEQDEDDADLISPSVRKLEKRDHDTEPIVEKLEREPEDQASAEIKKAWSIVAVEVPQKSDPPIHEKTEQVLSGSPQKKKRGRPRKRTAETEAEGSTAQAVRTEPEGPPTISTRATGTQQTRKKRKADSPPKILEDSASDTDDTTKPLSDHESDVHLSQSEGNSRPKSRTIDREKTTTTEQRSPSGKLTTPPKTPQKPPAAAEKGPDKHSPLTSGKVAYRVGLSKRARIAPLLKIVKK